MKENRDRMLKFQMFEAVANLEKHIVKKENSKSLNTKTSERGLAKRKNKSDGDSNFHRMDQSDSDKV